MPSVDKVPRLVSLSHAPSAARPPGRARPPGWSPATGHLASAALVALLALLPTGGVALAAPPGATREATVIEVRGNEFFIDAGTLDGFGEGAELEVFRRIEITHPVTRKKLVDRFPIGVVTLAEAGSIISIVKEFDALEPNPRVGDFVVRRGSLSPEPEPPPGRPGPSFEPGPTGSKAPQACPQVPAAPCPSAGQASVDPTVQLFAETRGKRPSERMAIWRRWLDAHPGHAGAPDVRRELEIFAQLISDDRTSVPSVAPSGPAFIARSAFPSYVASDQPLDVYVAVLPRAEAADVRLLVRREQDQGFTTLGFEPDGRLGMRTRLEGRWREPGKLFVRIEVQRPSGQVETITGPNDQIVTMQEAVRDQVDEGGRSRFSTRVDWLSFWMDEPDDWFLRVETDFRYRVRAGVLEAFRMGLGVFEGEGGPTDELDLDLVEGESRSVNYGFAEVEFALHELFGASARLLVGNYKEGKARQTFTSIFGGAFELRVGKLGATRLYGGLQSTEHVGDEFWLKVAIEEVAGWPMEASVVVTDLPVGADFGVSLGYGLTWQASDLLGITARVGWNARTINHSGFMLGTGMVLSW